MFLGRHASSLNAATEKVSIVEATSRGSGAEVDQAGTQTDKSFLFRSFQREANGIPGRTYDENEEVSTRISES